MNEDIAPDTPPAVQQLELPTTVWERLRRAREDAGKSTVQIAEETRIPRRMIEAIEAGDIAALPTGPYAVGFAKGMARALGLDEVAYADEVRALTSERLTFTPTEIYQPVEAGHIPSRMLAWTAAIIALLLVIAYSIWRGYGSDPAEMATAAGAEAAQIPGTPDTSATAAAPATTPLNDSAPLQLVALSEVWFGLNDDTGRLVFYRTLRAGERYVVTPEQRGLTLRTIRPQALQLVVGDRTLPQLGPDDRLVKDVALDTAGLAARLAGSGTAPRVAATAGPAVAPTPVTAIP
jgi:cytoskeleton protein RodZ